jgi:hypothetical protein
MPAKRKKFKGHFLAFAVKERRAASRNPKELNHGFGHAPDANRKRLAAASARSKAFNASNPKNVPVAKNATRSLAAW